MKIPASVRALFEELSPRYLALKSAVDALLLSKKERRWHYESRVKSDQSFALKLETGRELNPQQPEDFFACTLVVENQTRVREAESLASELFTLVERRPERSDFSPLPAHSFDFDDLRIYVAWKDDPALKPSGLAGLTFEFQIKTFLQHAWAVATHDLVYKTDAVSWATSRIAYQVKAALENAELSISEARRLTAAAVLNRTDRKSAELQTIIGALQARWQPEHLPQDLRRLALNVSELSRLLKLRIEELWVCVDLATAAGAGTKTLNLSPYGAILSAILYQRGPEALHELASSKKGHVFVPLEIQLPRLPANVMDHIVRPPV